MFPRKRLALALAASVTALGLTGVPTAVHADTSWGFRAPNPSDGSGSTEPAAPVEPTTPTEPSEPVGSAPVETTPAPGKGHHHTKSPGKGKKKGHAKHQRARR